MLRTLRVVLKNEEASGSQENVILEVQLFGEPIERVLIAWLSSLAPRFFPCVHYLGHKRRDRLRTTVIPQV